MESSPVTIEPISSVPAKGAEINVVFNQVIDRELAGGRMRRI